MKLLNFNKIVAIKQLFSIVLSLYVFVSSIIQIVYDYGAFSIITLIASLITLAISVFMLLFALYAKNTISHESILFTHYPSFWLWLTVSWSANNLLSDQIKFGNIMFWIELLICYILMISEFVFIKIVLIKKKRIQKRSNNTSE